MFLKCTWKRVSEQGGRHNQRNSKGQRRLKEIEVEDLMRLLPILKASVTSNARSSALPCITAVHTVAFAPTLQCLHSVHEVQTWVLHGALNELTYHWATLLTRVWGVTSWQLRFSVFCAQITSIQEALFLPLLLWPSAVSSYWMLYSFAWTPTTAMSGPNKKDAE